MTELRLHQTQGQVLRSQKRFRVVVAGRRWGKTRLAIAEMLKAAKRKPGGRVWYIGLTHSDVRDTAWVELKRFLPLPWVVSMNESELEVRLVNGTILGFKSAEKGDSLRGRGIDLLIPDEFQDQPLALWEEVLAPSLLDTEGAALFLGTPRAFNHLYTFFQRGHNGQAFPDWASWQFRSIDAAKPHGHLDPAMIELFRRTLDPRSFRQEFEASFEAVAGRAYYSFMRTVDVRPALLDHSLPACVSFDFNIDPACAVIGQRYQEDAWVWRESRKRHAGGEATRASARAVRDLLAAENFQGQVRIYGDATGRSGKTTGPSDHAVLRELFPGATWCIPHRNPHPRDRIAAVNARCQTMLGGRHLTVDPSCTGVIADLEQVVLDENGEPDKSNPELTHLSDCLGYWLVRDFPLSLRARAGATRVEWLL